MIIQLNHLNDKQRFLEIFVDYNWNNHLKVNNRSWQTCLLASRLSIKKRTAKKQSSIN